MQKNAIILAAGKGTRMKSEKNKVMHMLIDRPILAYPMDALKKAGADRIVIVAGYQADSLKQAFPEAEFAMQKEQLGTGHAVMQCTVLKDEPGLTLVMNGDVPCLKAETLERLYQEAQNHSLVLLSAILEDGAHYGRVVRDENGAVKAIVEAKDCNESQKQIREINAGVYCFNNRDLFDSLDKLTTNNAQHEYYLTDLVKILADKGKSVQAIAADPDEMAGINTVSELADVYTWMKDNTNRHWLENGVQIVDPARTVIGKDVKFGHDVIIWPDTHILGNTTIGDYVEILPQTWVNNSQIGDHSKIQASILDDAQIPEHSSVINQVVNTFKEG
ncbi:NTP transferase domain-containing protein [Erysipelotrichaceae bacterium RD49]|nr:NTP transferase domain-containing protein [Erysipelotrichaceae bacterium RD49]